MKHKSFFLLVLSLSALFVISPRQSFGAMVPYDGGTVTTIEGKITGVYTVDNRVTSELGYHLEIETGSGKYIVHVSPQWYEDKQHFQFMKGELLTVTGSAFTRDQEKNIYAASITRRFSSLPQDQQIALASEIFAPSSDIKALAPKYAITTDEAESIKTRVKQYLDQALFPKPIQLRDPKTGDGLWGGRFYDQNMPLVRQQKQLEMRKRMLEMRGKIPQGATNSN
jgi:hypothetical protein